MHSNDQRKHLEFLFAEFKCSQHPTSHLSFRKFTPSWQVMKPLSLLWLLVSWCSFLLLKMVSYFRVGSLFLSWLQYLRMCSQNACQVENLIINSSGEGCWIRDEDGFRKISIRNNTVHIFWVPHTFSFTRYFKNQIPI